MAHPNVLSVLTRLLPRARLAFGWTQADLAARARLSVGFISKLEQGVRGIRSGAAKQLLGAFESAAKDGGESEAVGDVIALLHAIASEPKAEPRRPVPVTREGKFIGIDAYSVIALQDEVWSVVYNDLVATYTSCTERAERQRFVDHLLLFREHGLWLRDMDTMARRPLLLEVLFSPLRIEEPATVAAMSELLPQREDLFRQWCAVGDVRQQTHLALGLKTWREPLRMLDVFTFLALTPDNTLISDWLPDPVREEILDAERKAGPLLDVLSEGLGRPNRRSQLE